MSIRSKLLTALLLILIHSASFVQAAEKTNWVSLGSKNGNLGASLGSRSGNTGWEIGFINTDDYLPSDVIQGGIPAGAVSLGDKKLNGAYGLDILKFFPANKSVTLYAGAGAYFQNHGEVFKSGSQLYTNNTENDVKFAYSGGIEFGKPGNVHFGIGYHSVRGANGQVYIKF